MNTISLEKEKTLIAGICLVAFFTLLMVISAFIRIPLFFTPVPLTMQTLVLFLSLVVLHRKAVFSQALYLVLGISGLNVFTNAGAGIVYILGPTGGYLLGFLLAALIMPCFLPKQMSFFKSVLYFTLTASLVYFCGLSWLVFMHKMSFTSAMAAGVYPFIPGAIIKITLASLFAARYVKNNC
ncbi:MAG: biotin transporter BioY [Candidatus Omnitrophica bacterium]|nr:biotin transporter BioY [Candidatus Omnitrophota bacterium]